MSRLLRATLVLVPFAAGAQSRIDVALSPAVPTPGVALRWSPKGSPDTLKVAGRTLTGAFPLGPVGSKPVAVRLAKAAGEVHYNTLWVDVNRDGKLSDNEKLTIAPKEIRGKWWSSFDTIVDVPVPAEAGQPATTRPYALALWYVEDPQEPKAKPVLRWSRRGWHIGQVDIAGKPAYVLITESEQDGRFDQRDWWALSRDSVAIRKLGPTEMREMQEHLWLDGQAYRPVRIDESGRSLAMMQIQPTTTEAEEKDKKDIYLPDRDVERAPRLAFAKELAATLAEAKRDHKRVLVDFEAVWCGPCHTMDTLVFTAKSVVTAAAGVLAVKVDGDDHRDLKLKYKVDGFPTLILLDSQGKEIRRAVGYQSVLQMVAMLKE